MSLFDVPGCRFRRVATVVPATVATGPPLLLLPSLLLLLLLPLLLKVCGDGGSPISPSICIFSTTIIIKREKKNIPSGRTYLPLVSSPFVGEVVYP